MKHTALGGKICLVGVLCVAALLACANGEGGRNVIVEGELLDGGAAADGSAVVGADGSTVIPEGDSGEAAACNGNIVLNEISTEGDNEYIELFNSGTCDVQLSGYSVEYASGKGNPPSSIANLSAQTISGRGFIVLGGPGFSGQSDIDLSSGLGSDGQLGLRKGSATIDEVAWGTITKNVFGEGTTATKPTASESIGRSPDGEDSNNNKSDFSLMKPSPGKAN